MNNDVIQNTQSTPSVLIIDDDAFAQEMFGGMLEELGVAEV